MLDILINAPHTRDDYQELYLACWEKQGVTDIATALREKKAYDPQTLGRYSRLLQERIPGIRGKDFDKRHSKSKDYSKKQLTFNF